MAEATTRPGTRQDGVFAAILQRPIARRLVRDGRYTVPICIILICGCFAAAALLQMRLDRSHALAQAATFERERAAAIATGAGQTLDRYARLGAVFAASPQQYRSADLGRAEPAIRDIAVWDGRGNRQARFQADTNAPFPRPQFAGPRASFPDGLAIRDGTQTIAVLFDPKSIALGSHRTALIPLKALPNGGISAAVPGWPLAVMTSVDEKNALADWAPTFPP